MALTSTSAWPTPSAYYTIPAVDWALAQVWRRVNSPRNDDADLLAPVADIDAGGAGGG